MRFAFMHEKLPRMFNVLVVICLVTLGYADPSTDSVVGTVTSSTSSAPAAAVTSTSTPSASPLPLSPPVCESPSAASHGRGDREVAPSCEAPSPHVSPPGVKTAGSTITEEDKKKFKLLEKLYARNSNMDGPPSTAYYPNVPPTVTQIKYDADAGTQSQGTAAEGDATADVDAAGGAAAPPTFDPEDSGPEARLFRFKQWLTENGAKIDAVNITYSPHYGYQILAARDLKMNSIVTSIPPKLIITSKKAIREGPYPWYQQFSSWYESTAVFLMQEEWKQEKRRRKQQELKEKALRDKTPMEENTEPGSFFAPYLDIIPSNFDDHPSLWTDDMVHKYFPSSRQKVLEFRRQVELSFVRIRSELVIPNPTAIPPAFFTMERFHTQLLRCITRAFANSEKAMDSVLDADYSYSTRSTFLSGGKSYGFKFNPSDLQSTLHLTADMVPLQDLMNHIDPFDTANVPIKATLLMHNNYEDIVELMDMEDDAAESDADGYANMDGVAPSRKKPRQPLKDRETDRAYQYRLAQMMAKQALVLAQGKVPEPYAWCLFTDSVYTKGQELFYSYGPLSNIDLFFSWGFVIENNRHDVMSVQLPPAMTRMYYYHVFMGIPDLAKPLMLMNRIKGEDGKTYSQVTNRALLMEGKDFRPLTLLHVCRMFVASNWPGNLFHLNSVSNLFLHRHETMSIHHELMACEVCFKTLPDLVDIVAMKKSAVAKFDQALAMGTTAPTYKYRFAYLYKKIIAEGFLSAKMYFFRRQVFIHQNCRLPTPLEEEYFMK